MAGAAPERKTTAIAEGPGEGTGERIAEGTGEAVVPRWRPPRRRKGHRGGPLTSGGRRYQRW